MSQRNTTAIEQYRKKHPKCERCGMPASEVHHIIPVSEGGMDCDGNLISLCRDCHNYYHKENRSCLTAKGLLKTQFGMRTPEGIEEMHKIFKRKTISLKELQILCYEEEVTTACEVLDIIDEMPDRSTFTDDDLLNLMYEHREAIREVTK